MITILLFAILALILCKLFNKGVVTLRKLNPLKITCIIAIYTCLGFITSRHIPVHTKVVTSSAPLVNFDHYVNLKDSTYIVKYGDEYNFIIKYDDNKKIQICQTKIDNTDVLYLNCNPTFKINVKEKDNPFWNLFSMDNFVREVSYSLIIRKSDRIREIKKG